LGGKDDLVDREKSALYSPKAIGGVGEKAFPSRRKKRIRCGKEGKGRISTLQQEMEGSKV